MKYDLKTYILIFFIYSIAGWCMEVIRMFFNPKYKKFVNRGFLIGPYLPIYGSGVVGITLFLSKYSNDLPALFCLSIILCGFIEYMTSFVMEKLFNARWWDYSSRKFNINGRVCLETLIPFGVAGTAILHWINPILIDLLNKIPNLPKTIIVYLLVSIFIIDSIISFTIISKFKKSANDIDLSEADDTENISNYVKDKAENAAMQLESDIRKGSRKRRLKRQRKILHLKLRTNKKIAKAKLESKELQKKVTSEISKKLVSAKKSSKEFSEKINAGITEKISSAKASSDEISKKLKESFSKHNLLTRRLMNAFPNVKILLKKENANNIEKNKNS